ncbi:MAG: phosphotransferase [Methylohalobius sp.]|nr:phosphotransferase [Methylohalobius sp.]
MSGNSRVVCGDGRFSALLAWVERDLGLHVQNWQMLAGDASARCYLRLWTGVGSAIAMLAPSSENAKAFVAVAELLRRVGMRVPAIYAQHVKLGFWLLEDFGDLTYFHALQSGLNESLYEAALAALSRLQTQLDPASANLPAYDEALLRRELDIFHQWLAKGWLGIEMPKTMWEKAIETLVASALEQPKVVVHRDYHSRNLMVLPEKTPGVLDFQDAVVGPVTYDVVSLLRDCYLVWPPAWVKRQLEAHRLHLAQAGMKISADAWQIWVDRMGAQRHLKAAGIFARLHLRDGKSGYLQDIPRTLDYVVEVAREDLKLHQLGQFLQVEVLPRVRERLACGR